MPKNNMRVSLLINYDPAKDAISITADKAKEPDLAAGGLYITLKPGTQSETLLRTQLMKAEIIKRKTTALTLNQLMENGAISKSNATLLSLLAKDNSGLLINGSKRDTSMLAASYIDARNDPNTVIISRNADQFMGELLSPLLAAAVYIDAYDIEKSGKDITYEDLMRRVYRMRPDFIVQDLYGPTALEELHERPGDLHGFIYLDDNLGRGYIRSLSSDEDFTLAQAVPGAQRAGCKAIVLTHHDSDLPNGFRVRRVELI